MSHVTDFLSGLPLCEGMSGLEVAAVAAFLLLALVAAHAGAALKHHFLDRDATLRRMLPGRS